jgi:hypothetical protein
LFIHHLARTAPIHFDLSKDSGSVIHLTVQDQRKPEGVHKHRGLEPGRPNFITVPA